MIVLKKRQNVTLEVLIDDFLGFIFLLLSLLHVLVGCQEYRLDFIDRTEVFDDHHTARSKILLIRTTLLNPTVLIDLLYHDNIGIHEFSNLLFLRPLDDPLATE